MPTPHSSPAPLGALPPWQQEEPDQLDASYAPEGLDQELWEHFQDYRGQRVRRAAQGYRQRFFQSHLL